MDDLGGNKRVSNSKSPNKRLKSQHISTERVHELVHSEKGEAIQALHAIFHHTSISFQTREHNALSGTFVTFLDLEGYCFIGYGKKKSASRAAASKIALIFFLTDSRRKEFLSYQPVVQQLITDEATPDSLPNIIASSVLAKYEQLREESKRHIPWFKMISSMVIVRNEDVKNVEVIALSTGSKCIEPKNIRLDGSVILDSHAETLIRRSLQYFLYLQLSSPHPENTILEKRGSKFRIKPEISFHLFVNSAPCGDSRIFTISDKESSHDKHPNRISRGMLRIKLDGGNSTVPLINSEKYDSKRLMIMSCSDKLLKSNVLGLQGSLLANLIEPIYLDGIVIGDSYRMSHLTRALYERAEDVDLPSPFQVRRPTIYGLDKVPKVVSKSPKTSVNWICGTSPEVIDSTTGRTMSGQLSRLCKRNLFKMYIDLRNLPEKTYFYERCKRECKEYRAARKSLYEILESKRLGKWIERAPSFDAFEVEKDVRKSKFES